MGMLQLSIFKILKPNYYDNNLYFSKYYYTQMKVSLNWLKQILIRFRNK